MSALRISLPGQPVRFVDLGPAVGRTSHTRLQGGNRTLIAGELVTGTPRIDHPGREAAKREYERSYYAAHKEAALERQRRYREKMK